MKVFAIAALASAAVAAPAAKAVTDTDILQYALTLEHLENAFYKGALAKFSPAAFRQAGFSEKYYENVRYIAFDEQSHVDLLTKSIAQTGAHPVQPCTYSFPYTDVKSFVALSSVLEGVGTSAYLGGAGLITSKEYLGVAGSILVTEALHTSLQRFKAGEISPANPYGTGLGINPVYTLAAAFIKHCPSTNAKLPVKAYPTLTAKTANPVAQGQTVTFKKPQGVHYGQKLYVTYFSGLVIESVPAYSDYSGHISAKVPKDVSGQTYAILTNCNVSKAPTDSQVVAGPAILEVTPAPV